MVPGWARESTALYSGDSRTCANGDLPGFCICGAPDVGAACKLCASLLGTPVGLGCLGSGAGMVMSRVFAASCRLR